MEDMYKKVTIVFGTAIILVTLTNFVPAAVVRSNGTRLLFGMFLVGTPLEVIHLTVGIVGLAVGAFTRYSRAYLQVFGIVFAVLAVAGFAGGDTVLQLFDVNLADNLLHSGFAVALLGASFYCGRTRQPREGATSSMIGDR